MKDSKGHGSNKKNTGSGAADLSSRNLAKYGLRRGAYDGSNSRRFVTFSSAENGNERRSEFTSKRERDDHVARLLTDAQAARQLAEGSQKSAAVPIHSASQNFPITLIGDPGHAEAQKATIARLKRQK